MNSSILTEKQVLFLKLFSRQTNPSRQFYLAGGTALAALYLPYHLSEKLVKKAKIKFDWHVDPLKLGSRFLLSKDLKGYRHLVPSIEKTAW